MKRLLFIGAGFLQSFIIKKAKQMGCYVLALDGDPNAPGFGYADEYEVISIVDQQACLEYAKKKNVNGVLTAATDYGVLTASLIARELNLVGVNYRTAEIIKNKYAVRQCLSQNHIDDADEAYFADKNTDYNELGNKLDYPVMVKPIDGSGSRAARKVCSAEELEDACRTAIRASNKGYAEIEKFICGTEYGVEIFVENGNIHVFPVMKKWVTKPPYYAELGHAIPSGLNAALEQKVRDIVKNAIVALGVNTGSVNMDILVTDEGKIYIVDVGARMGGNMIGSYIIPYGTGIDYPAAMIQNAFGDPADMSEGNKSPVATRLLAFDDGYVTKLPDFAAIEKKFDVEIFHHMKEGDMIHEYHTNLDGCGYIIARADTVAEASEKAEKALQYITNIIF